MFGNCIASAFVSPVSRNPVFGYLVHFTGSDLKLNGTFRSVNRRMNRLIAIGLWIGNIILETSWHWTPQLMNIAQHSIDIARRFHDTANSNQVIELIKPLLLIVHFTVNGVNVLWSTVNMTFQVAITRITLNLIHNLCHQGLPLTALLCHHAGNLVKFNLVEIAERHIFQFPLDRRNPQAVRKWSIYFHGFS
ncbi:Uncharacterised protein [Chlamydia trachomatis]|nr:Uncharacterised protein [Chlamydia trachomatis]